MLVRSALRKAAELENVIAVVEAVAEEKARRQPPVRRSRECYSGRD
jgi:hypothetical protein